MTPEDHRRTVARYQAGKGKATPSEYMAYMWSRQALGERLSAGQRGLLAAAQKPAWHHDSAAPTAPKPSAAPATPPPTNYEPDDVPAWVTDGE